MYEREMAEKNKILVIKSGSHLYDLNTPTSDEDYIGVFIPDEEYILGFKNCEQVDLSYKSKLDNGKNSSEAVDCTFYSIQKFINLALNQNPNILEVLFVNEENIVFCNDAGRRLLALKEFILSDRIETTFFGYAKSQKRKIEVKSETYYRLINAKKYLEPFGNKYLLEIKSEDTEKFNNHFKDKDKYLFGLGDISLNKNQTAKKACSVIGDRIGECGNRIELIKDRGMDTKFASHIIRLMAELKQVALEKTLTFPIKYDKEKIMDVKMGKLNVKDTILAIENSEKECREVTPLLKELKQDRIKIEKEIIKIIKDWFKWK